MCHSELGEFRAPTAPISALESVHMQPGSDGKPVLPSIDPVPIHRRLEELQAIGELASKALELEGSRLAVACRRAESLLRSFASSSSRTSALVSARSV